MIMRPTPPFPVNPVVVVPVAPILGALVLGYAVVKIWDAIFED